MSGEGGIYTLDRALERDALENVQLRSDVAERLSEIVALPESRISPHDRHLAGDILVALLRTAPRDLRRRCAQGLARVNDPPKAALRYLARDEIDVAGPLLETGVGFDDCDLISVLRVATPQHAERIAARRSVSETVAEQIVLSGDQGAIARALRNPGVRFPAGALDRLTRLSRERRALTPLLLKREELRASQAFALFWWADHPDRLAILRRFATERGALVAEFDDLLARAASENWSDPEARKALQVIERRQRNRAAGARSPFGSLENAIAVAAEQGIDRALAAEISHLAGVRPVVGLRVFADDGGEAAAVFCKACGLKRDRLRDLMRALREAPPEAAARAELTFDLLSTAKAQTVLRHWNWAFTSDAAVLDENALELPEFAPARRFASIVQGAFDDDGRGWRTG